MYAEAISAGCVDTATAEFASAYCTYLHNLRERLFAGHNDQARPNDPILRVFIRKH